MSQPKYVYHGSGKKFDKLIPKKAEEVDKNKIDNSLKAIYASDIKEEAIVMGILSCKGVGSSSLLSNNKDKAYGIIYKGWPKQNYFYLYTLITKNFEERPKKSHQFVSFKQVKPAKIEKLLVKYYIHLVRKATKKEKEDW